MALTKILPAISDYLSRANCKY